MWKQEILKNHFLSPLFVLLALTITSCTFNLIDRTPSREEGAITVYTSLRQEEVDLYLRDFRIAYPDIRVTLRRDSADQLIERLMAERDAPRADALWGIGLSSALYFEWNDLLKPYAPLGLSRIEPRFRDANQPPYWVGNSVFLSAFCININEVARLGAIIPETWEDLLDPNYRRSVVMANPASGNSGLMAVMGILEKYGEQIGWQYLDALHRNIVFYPQEEGDVCKLVDQGDYAIGIARTFDNLGKIEMVYPDGPSGWELTVSALVRKDPIKPAARTFLDWSTSEATMRLYARKAALTAVNTGLPVPAGYPLDPEARLIERNIPWSAANRERILDEWLRRYGDKLER